MKGALRRDIDLPQTMVDASPTATVAESEGLLWAASRVAREESAEKGPEEEIVVIHITIKGVGEWYLDSTGEIDKVQNGGIDEGADNSASLHLSYASDEIFVALAHK